MSRRSSVEIGGSLARRLLFASGAIVFALTAAFATQAFAAPDAYEPDDTPGTARPAPFSPVAEAHNLEAGAVDPDIDWYSFSGTFGHVYHITASVIGGTLTDPVVDVYSAGPTVWMAGNDDGAYAQRYSSLYWRCSTTGSYRFCVRDPKRKRGLYSVTVQDLGIESEVQVARIGGADRYDVAKNALLQHFPGYAGVFDIIICSGLDKASADSLVAAGLAGRYHAPILLVRADRAYLPAPTAEALHGIFMAQAPTTFRVHIVGGPASVPEALKAKIKAQLNLATFTRYGGADRYAVAANVSHAIRDSLPIHDQPYDTLVCNGQNPTYFSDALAAGAIAGSANMTVLLTKSTAVPSSTRAELNAHNWTVYAVGNATAISESVRTSIHGTRIGGPGRSDTARLLAERAVASDWADMAHVGVTNKVSDALSGGALLALDHGVMLYTSYATLDTQTGEYANNHALSATLGYIFGGPASVSDSTRYFMELAFLHYADAD